MSPSEVEAGLQNVMRCLSHQHAGIDAVFSDRYRQLAHLMPPAEQEPSSPPQSLLIGAYFMSEYSLQSAALFNPSIVPHPDQEDVPAGALRFVMSLRATGEGHFSSIENREGLISVDGDLAFGPVSTSVRLTRIRYPRYRKADFVATLLELGIDEPFVAAAFGDLAPTFDPGELEGFLRHPERWPPSTTGEHEQQSIRDAVRWAAHCDYVVEFPRSLRLSERVIFPVSPREQGGIEDARFVRFREDDGSHRYYATYTAFDRNELLAADDRDRGFSEVQAPAIARRGGAKQRHGAVPSPYWRPLRHAGPPGRRERHPHVL